MKKIVSLLILIAVLIPSLFSCGDIKYDENEVKTAAKKLIEESILLNDIYFGEGIPYIDDKNNSDGVFYMALDSYLYLIGFSTVAELMDLTSKTFSKSYCNQIYSTVLDTIQDEDKAIILPRYYQKYSVGDATTPECIMVNSTYRQLLFGDVEYDYDSITVIGAEDDTVYITVHATVKLDAYDPQTREIRIALVDEGKGWRIDSPTYLTYVK